jgi:hypothetical protein
LAGRPAHAGALRLFVGYVPRIYRIYMVLQELNRTSVIAEG